MPAVTADRQAVRRRSRALERYGELVAGTDELAVPTPVERIVKRPVGVAPKLPAEAFELARQVYYLQHGTLRDAARAVIAAGLSDSGDLTINAERLKTWWQREGWPRREAMTAFAIRDANFDGGLFRSQRTCAGHATGNGPAPKGQPCSQSALKDSAYCFHHDPRPAFEEQRRLHGQHLRAGRRAGMVPLAPLQTWCHQQRARLLEGAKANGPVHHNAVGWGLLAHAMGIDASTLGRVISGKHSNKDRPPVTEIRATTVARYIEPLGFTFQGVYGYDPPTGTDRGRICPACGGAKLAQSQSCRRCHDAANGEPCTYVNRRGERCSIPTKHESRYCGKCRRIVERVPRPRTGRPSALTPERLILALGEYRDVPIHAWVANRMWAANAGDVRSSYRNAKSLTGSLVKQFRKREWRTVDDADRGYAELVEQHGLVAWPRDVAEPLEATGMVPAAPFLTWLAAQKAEGLTYKALGERVGLDPDRLSAWLQGKAEKTTIRRETVGRAVERWGDGTAFASIYGDGE